METLTRTQNSVAFHLLKAVFVLYFLFTFVLTVSHMLLEYRNTKNAVNRELMLVQQSFSQGLSTALFELNEEQLHAIVTGMVTLPAVTGVQIETVGASVAMTDALGTVINAEGKQVLVSETAEQPNRDALFWQDFTIYFQDSNRVLGAGRIYSSDAVVYEQVKAIFVIILGGAVLKTAALWFLFLWAARSRLNRPITVLTSVMGAIKFDTGEQLAIDIKPAAKRGRMDIRFDLADRFHEQVEVHDGDEIHHLTASFKSMSASIQRKLQGLNLLSNMAAGLLNAPHADVILSEVAQVLVQHYRMNQMVVLLCDELLCPDQAWCWSVTSPEITTKRLPTMGRAAQAIFGAARLSRINATELNELLPTPVAADTPLINVPLIDAEHRLGSLIFASDSPAIALGQEDEAFLNAMARLLIIAMRNTQMLTLIREQSRTLEKQVNLRTEQLQRAVKELEGFNYAVSHDLQAPLRHVNSFLHLLVEDIPEVSQEKVRPLVDRMQKALQRMRDLIEGMLALASTGHASPHTEPVSLATLVNEVISELPAETLARTRFELGDFETVQADRTLLRQVLQNLIDNAVKYASKVESPCVRIQCVASADPQQAVVLVRDNGVGFDPQYVSKLFNLFQRLHRAEEFPGTGVGLAICAKIIQLHGGRIWAEGALHQGASFYFSIPISAAGDSAG